jgi:hypothetical protein
MQWCIADRRRLENRSLFLCYPPLTREVSFVIFFGLSLRSEASMGKMKSRLTLIALLWVAFSFMFLPNAHAYVDPASGSYVFQVLIGAIVGVGLAVKLFWRKISSLFLKIFSRKGQSAEVQSSEVKSSEVR